MTEDNYLSSLEQANACVVKEQYAKAIEILKPLVNSDISAIQGVISFCLGDIYRCCDGTDDKIHAKKHLNRAIELASAAEDSQVVIAAKAALAQVETVLGNEEQAQCYMEEARDKFQALPEHCKWAELQERLEGNSVVKYLLFKGDCGECTPTDHPEIPGRRNPSGGCVPCPNLGINSSM